MDQRTSLLLIAWLLFAAALVAMPLAIAWGSLLCENGCEGTLGTIRSLQVGAALAGLMLTALAVAFAHQGRGRWVVVALLLALGMYLIWGVLLELLTHPTDHGILP